MTLIDVDERGLIEFAAEPAPRIPDGVYLNLPESAYHADPALGSTDLKAILTNPVQWHARNRNPARDLYYPPKVDDSVAKRFGRAVHKIVLEGSDAFDAAYFVAPSPPEGLLEKNEELHAFVSERAAATGGIAPWFTGLPELITESIVMKKGGIKKTARKEHLIAAARHLGCDALFCDWEAGVLAEANGRELISAEWWRKMHTIRAVLDGHSVAGRYLQKGLPEVSVFWSDEDGCRFKCRFDYLRQRVVTDLKTYASRDGLEPIQTFVYAIESFAYDVSRAHYMRARLGPFVELIEAGKVYEMDGLEAPDAPAARDLAFLRKCAAETAPAWAWVACMTLGFPEVDAIEIPDGLLATAAAETQLDEAVAKYKDFRARFGDDDAVPWLSDRGTVVIDDAMFSMRSTNRGAIRWASRDD